MIEVTVQEAYEDYPIKKIILNDLDVGMERSIWVSSKITCLDKDNNFIYEEITIINRLNRIGTIEIYAGEKYNLVAYTEQYSSREAKNNVDVFTVDHYILINNQFVLMARDIDEHDLKGGRINHFDKNGNLYFYRIVNFDLFPPESHKEYDKDGGELGFWNLHFMENEDIYRTTGSVTRELEQAVIEKYRIDN
ncbi:hypothetical protein NDN11_02995 [Acinetobacter sp. C26M]|uniref:hypothetical protein n=1 Tax=unclassified Acinetobacter TaxID=196816 RepID=UPI0020368897|nr:MULTISPECIES: hypothetical protein [unclassified Acinetobacter]USA47115.1 hypothetical protein NDN11_02995 [Acinetobacter sp. C26M]USA50596.1 hypothetical protein NDN12_02995 [Acinetobacter sp. C26G]